MQGFGFAKAVISQSYGLKQVSLWFSSVHTMKHKFFWHPANVCWQCEISSFYFLSLSHTHLFLCTCVYATKLLNPSSHFCHSSLNSPISSRKMLSIPLGVAAPDTPEAQKVFAGFLLSRRCFCIKRPKFAISYSNLMFNKFLTPNHLCESGINQHHWKPGQRKVVHDIVRRWDPGPVE